MLFRVDIEGCFFSGKQLVEGGVEDADDLRTFIVDDRLCFLVPENRDGEPGRQGGIRARCGVGQWIRDDTPAAIVGICFEIEIFDVLGVVQRVGVRAGERIHAGKRPSEFAHVGRYGGDG